MHTEMKDIPIRAQRPTQRYVSPEDDPLWDAITSFRISMPLHKLLQLMPRFKDTLASLTTGTKPTSLPVNLAEPGTGPPLMDSQNPVVKFVIKGRDIHGCIIDGGSGVNVISEATCQDLGHT